MKLEKKINPVKISNSIIFDNLFIYVQSMCSYPYSKMNKLEDQISKISMTNCALLRLSIRNEKDIEYARLLKDKYQRQDFVFVADTHFLPELAIKCIKNGFMKVRINPGNMNLNEMKQIAKVAKDYNASIRIGLNGGSINEKKDFKKKNYVNHYINLFQNYIEPFERENFKNIILSAKFSDFKLAIKVNKALYERFNYPIHLGVTEAGTIIRSTILHTLFLREMLQKKIGSTVRISITGDSINEIDTANEILKSLGIYKGINIISCPTCGRTWGNLLDYVATFSEKIKPIEYQLLKREKMHLKPINCAIMGCEVNGPNEAKDADFGVSLTKNGAIIFSKGEILEKIKREDIVDRLISCIKDEIYKI